MVFCWVTPARVCRSLLENSHHPALPCPGSILVPALVLLGSSPQPYHHSNWMETQNCVQLVLWPKTSWAVREEKWAHLAGKIFDHCRTAAPVHLPALTSHVFFITVPFWKRWETKTQEELRWRAGGHNITNPAFLTSFACECCTKLSRKLLVCYICLDNPVL